jgi:hypothetical protein
MGRGESFHVVPNPPQADFSAAEAPADMAVSRRLQTRLLISRSRVSLAVSSSAAENQGREGGGGGRRESPKKVYTPNLHHSADEPVLAYIYECGAERGENLMQGISDERGGTVPPDQHHVCSNAVSANQGFRCRWLQMSVAVLAAMHDTGANPPTRFWQQCRHGTMLYNPVPAASHSEPHSTGTASYPSTGKCLRGTAM